ncbi:MAG: hypothetical protein JXX29_02030, partial [Deltaproteobacteria bacterium]|nr:hypothetical protein [Deltaproteobacteria bacterium]MBN2670420.1 hypothetical protein [Deltaproteobacteria bacterium]
MSDEDPTITPQQINQGETADISISHPDLSPGVYRNFSCGSEPIAVDDDFKVRVHVVGSDGNWLTIENISWNFDKNQVDGFLSAEASARLEGWVELKIETPTGATLHSANAFFVVTEADSDSDTPADTETDSESETETE